jgi:uncharacterized protein
MESVFIDTGAFFAVKIKTDKNHETALKFFNFVLENKPFSFVTSDFIIFETVTLFKSKINILDAIKIGKFFRESENIRIVKITDELISNAWDIFDKYDDKEFSFVDCSSFAFMKKHNIKKAFTFDNHFKQFGFEIIP